MVYNENEVFTIPARRCERFCGLPGRAGRHDGSSYRRQRNR